MNLKLTLATIMTLTTTALAGNEPAIPMQDRSIATLVGNEHATPEQGRVLESARRSWKISLIAVAASQALDISSSYGMRELNPALRSADGSFGAKAAGIKIGGTAAIIALEYLVIKAHPGAAKAFTKLNWAGAAVTSSFAVHNYAIR